MGQVARFPGTNDPPQRAKRPLRVALVNNMPDLAFEETNRQFDRLSHLSSYAVQTTCYYVESVPRQRDLYSDPAGYLPVEALYRTRPDALIVTGTEPKEPDLEDEPYWADLAELLRWAAETVPAVLLSCLASHAALLALEGIGRIRLPRKQSGIYSQWVYTEHELADDLGWRLSFPHSRLNDVPLQTLLDRGIRPLVASPLSGWTVATRATPAGMMLLLQGHPEYGTTTLLREYRRDVRRYLGGSMADHPDLPFGYLDAEGAGILEQFRSKCELRGTRPEDFPFDAVAPHIIADWSASADQLFRNWMEHAGQLAHVERSARAGGNVFAR
jgi:homoserine O-succinyltransferase